MQQHCVNKKTKSFLVRAISFGILIKKKRCAGKTKLNETPLPNQPVRPKCRPAPSSAKHRFLNMKPYFQLSSVFFFFVLPKSTGQFLLPSLAANSHSLLLPVPSSSVPFLKANTHRLSLSLSLSLSPPPSNHPPPAIVYLVLYEKTTRTWNTPSKKEFTSCPPRTLGCRTP